MYNENSYDNTSQIENQKKFYISINPKNPKKNKTLKNNNELIDLEDKISKMIIIDENTIQSKIVKKNIKNFLESEKTIFLDKPTEINKLIIHSKRETFINIIDNKNKKNFLTKKEIDIEIKKNDNFKIHFFKHWSYFGKILLNLFISIFVLIFYVVFYILMIILLILEFVIQIIVFIIYLFYFCFKSCCKTKNYNPLKKNAMKLRSLPFLEKIKNNKYIICFEPKNFLYYKTEKKPKHKKFIKTYIKNLDEPTKVLYIIIRPYAKEFIIEMSKYFKLKIFTTDEKKYSENIERIYDPQNLIFERYYSRDLKNCNGEFFYDFELCCKNLDNFLFLDCNNFFINEMDYYFDVKRFSGDLKDNELKDLVSFFRENVIWDKEFKLKDCIDKRNNGFANL